MTVQKVRSAIAAFLLAWLPACYSYRTTTVAPEEAIAGQQVVIVRVPQDAGTREVRLKSPWVRNDSIGGLECTTVRTAGGGGEACERDWAVPLADVRALETRSVNTGKTVVAVLSGVVIAAGLAVAVSWGIYCSNNPNDMFC